MMFYAGALAASQNSTTRAKLQTQMDPWIENPFGTTVTGQVIGDHTVYVTDYTYFGGAVLVELICILVILPIYWGYWTLGRRISFSPLELAKVSLFRACHCHRDMLTSTGF